MRVVGLERVVSEKFLRQVIVSQASRRIGNLCAVQSRPVSIAGDQIDQLRDARIVGFLSQQVSRKAHAEDDGTAVDRIE